VFLTAGLVDVATDDEIAAAIAHELGHLLGDGSMQSAVSLRGINDSLDVERRADAIGCRLLLAAHRPREALISVLVKVSDSSSSEDCRRDIQQRIDAIRQELRTGAP
jgi:Zn-dependent protease with chaperone function